MSRLSMAIHVYKYWQGGLGLANPSKAYRKKIHVLSTGLPSKAAIVVPLIVSSVAMESVFTSTDIITSRYSHQIEHSYRVILSPSFRNESRYIRKKYMALPRYIIDNSSA
jgi:hypothetical protein